MSVRMTALAALVAALPFAAQAQQATGMGNGGDADYMKAMQTMHEAMAAMKPTGDADKDFAAMMIPHHQGAVDMAKIELASGKNPALRKMAKAIIAAQERELAQMRAWQRRNGSRR